MGHSKVQISFVSSPPNMALYTPQVHQDTRKRMTKLSEQSVQLSPYSKKWWDLQCPADLQVNPPTEWPFTEWITYGASPANTTAYPPKELFCTLMYSPKSTRQWKWKKDRIQCRLNQQLSFNKWHRAVELPGDHVLLRDQDKHGLILGKTEQLRSYFVDTNKGTRRRNRSALVVTTKHPATEHSNEDLPSETTTAPNSTFTNSTITAVAADKRETNGRTSDGDFPRDSACCWVSTWPMCKYLNSFRKSCEATRAPGFIEIEH